MGKLAGRIDLRLPLSSLHMTRSVEAAKCEVNVVYSWGNGWLDTTRKELCCSKRWDSFLWLGMYRLDALVGIEARSRSVHSHAIVLCPLGHERVRPVYPGREPNENRVGIIVRS